MITYPQVMPSDFCDMVAVNGVPSWRNPDAYMRSHQVQGPVTITDKDRLEITSHIQAGIERDRHNLNFRLSFKDAESPTTRAWFMEGVSREEESIQKGEAALKKAASATSILWKNGSAIFR